MDTVPGCYAVLPVGCLSSALNALDASISNTSSVLSLLLERELYVGKKTQKKEREEAEMRVILCTSASSLIPSKPQNKQENNRNDKKQISKTNC